MKFISVFFLSLSLSVAVLATQPSIYGENGVVVAHDLEACEAGIEILKKGGNAVDAAVAVSYALAVTHPHAGNIGGGGFMLIHMADGQKVSIDYREMAPGQAHRDMFLGDSGKVVPQLSTRGGLAVGVPGTVAGLQLALDEYGSMTRKKVMKPAIKLAQKGFAIPYDLAYSFGWLNKSAEGFDETRRVFCRDGDYMPGETFKQPDLAKTLKLIQKMGNAGFYEGAVAEALVKSSSKYGGKIQEEDLLNYTAHIREPVVGMYRGLEVMSMPPPSSGGIALISMLNMMEPMAFDSVGWHSAQHIQMLAEVEKRVYADRSVWLGDPDYFEVPQDKLLSKEYAALRMADYDSPTITPSDSIYPLNDSDLASIELTGHESEETTHFSVVDKWGNAVSVTTTLNWSFGSYVTVAGFGFLLNNEMDDFSSKPGEPNSFGLIGNEANAIEPRKRMLSSMTPTILSRDGKVVLVVGAPGGSTIITTVLQVINNMVDFGMPVHDAVNVPRFHHQWRPDVIHYGPGAISPDTIVLLREMGYELTPRYGYGEVNAISRDKIFGGWIGAPDLKTASHGAAY